MNVTTEKTDEPAEWAEQRRVGERLRVLIDRLGLNQETFADASGDHLSRIAVNRALNGGRGDNPGTLARTEKWLNGVAEAVGVQMADAQAYLVGSIDVDALFQRRRRTIDLDNQYSHNLRIAIELRGDKWHETTRAALARHANGLPGGDDYPVAVWLQRGDTIEHGGVLLGPTLDDDPATAKKSKRPLKK